VHDFVIPANGKAIPNGVYDLQRNEGWVSLGIDHDTASFAVNAIRRWWQRMGRPAHPKARSLVITADAGGSNGRGSAHRDELAGQTVGEPRHHREPHRLYAQPVRAARPVRDRSWPLPGRRDAFF
jgi:hypothetical protein